MSLRIQQLNGDTTFLLTFYPPFAPQRLSKRLPADFTILIDPWLRGYASMLHPSFLLSYHTSTPALHSLQDLRHLPDVIIISQDKPDHCHKETLCSFPNSPDTSILATAAAAKKIRSWKHFDDNQIHSLENYDPLDEDSVIRIPLPGYSSSSIDGEITIANIPTKRDIVRVHNAIGITYRPPSTILTGMHHTSRRSTNGSSIRLSSEPGTSSAPTSLRRSPATSIGTSQVTTSMQQEDVLSVIYSPHGISPEALEPYVVNHLDELDALPISALLHSFNIELNPWFMGGVIATGAPGGMKLRKRWHIDHWVSAHDEVKVNKGLATTMIKSTQYDVEEVEAMLEEAGLTGTKVHDLDVGETLRIPEVEGAIDHRIRTRMGVGGGLSMSNGQRMNVEDNVLAMPEPKRPLSSPDNVIKDPAYVAPGTRMRIRREITHPDGMWI